MIRSSRVAHAPAAAHQWLVAMSSAKTHFIQRMVPSQVSLGGPKRRGDETSLFCLNSAERVHYHDIVPKEVQHQSSVLSELTPHPNVLASSP